MCKTVVNWEGEFRNPSSAMKYYNKPYGHKTTWEMLESCVKSDKAVR